jgi:hypothetical protein
MNAYRKGLPERPLRMRKLPLNDKGYPVPWFVAWDDGKPEFRAMDGEKWARAVKHRLCWLCGKKLGRRMTFVAGPMCGINRTSAEPPCHHECAEYSARACPFLTLPKAIRRDSGLPEELRLGSVPTKDTHIIGGTAITRNPGVAMLWTTTSYKVHRVDNGHVIEMGEPELVEWFAEGRGATRAEVDESIRTGMLFLQDIADEQGGDAPLALMCYVERMQPLLPA